MNAASLSMASLFRHECGYLATGKKIPDAILFNSDESLLRSFLDGYIAGDGCFTRTWDGYRLVVFNTVSKVLILQAQLAYARLGRLVSVRISRERKRGMILGREVNLNEQYEGRMYDKPVTNSSMDRLHGNMFYLPVLRIGHSHYDGLVYNIATGDHTYLISNFVSHNCGHCDTNFVCNRIGTGEYVNSWYDRSKNACWIGKK